MLTDSAAVSSGMPAVSAAFSSGACLNPPAVNVTTVKAIRKRTESLLHKNLIMYLPPYKHALQASGFPGII
jgi:hypothetical protein